MYMASCEMWMIFAAVMSQRRRKGKRSRMEKCYNRECTFNRAENNICECPCAGFCGGFVSKVETVALHASNKTEESDNCGK